MDVGMCVLNVNSAKTQINCAISPLMGQQEYICLISKHSGPESQCVVAALIVLHSSTSGREDGVSFYHFAK